MYCTVEQERHVRKKKKKKPRPQRTYDATPKTNWETKIRYSPTRMHDPLPLPLLPHLRSLLLPDDVHFQYQVEQEHEEEVRENASEGRMSFLLFLFGRWTLAGASRLRLEMRARVRLSREDTRGVGLSVSVGVRWRLVESEPINLRQSLRLLVHGFFIPEHIHLLLIGSLSSFQRRSRPRAKSRIRTRVQRGRAAGSSVFGHF